SPNQTTRSSGPFGREAHWAIRTGVPSVTPFLPPVQGVSRALERRLSRLIVGRRGRIRYREPYWDLGSQPAWRPRTRSSPWLPVRREIAQADRGGKRCDRRVGPAGIPA